MNTDATLQIDLPDSDATEQLGFLIGQRLCGGEVIELAGDVGSGKTTFTKGLARGAGSRDVVSSPSFTISQEYEAKKFTIVHFDFYRLSEAGVVGQEMVEYIGNEAYVTVIEWGETVEKLLPLTRLKVSLLYTSEHGRTATLVAPEPLTHLTQGVL
ncbi:MAG: tRNA (adenosine(37)-N6)-threonylcarbamoyltransferase complex ATPase subunit type 1 TsaE [Candidatus Saccharimonadales bacterium]